MTGHNSMKMTDLAALYHKMGFTDAETYIQSGNVIFSGNEELSESDTARIIENEISGKFDYSIPVMIRSLQEISKIISINPFLNEELFAPSKVAVIFLHEKVTESQQLKVTDVDYPPDKFHISGSEIFIFCPNGFGRTKLYTNFFEKKMGVVGTARNWKTITTVLNILEKR